jgi:E3 ubiquitin-protein ligase HUWE1
LVKELFNADYCLFRPSDNGLWYEPSISSYVNHDGHIQYFKLAGEIIARAIIENKQVAAHLSPSINKQLLGLPLKLKDLETVDKELYDSLNSLYAIDPADAFLSFHRLYEEFGQVKVYELIENGSNIDVTEENKIEYINRMFKHRLYLQYEEQIDSFVNAFHMIIPQKKLQLFSPSEIDLIICGVPDININELENNTVFHEPYHLEHPIIRQLFALFRKWDRNMMAKFLFFLTGSSQVPVGGFADNEVIGV